MCQRVFFIQNITTFFSAFLNLHNNCSPTELMPTWCVCTLGRWQKPPSQGGCSAFQAVSFPSAGNRNMGKKTIPTAFALHIFQNTWVHLTEGGKMGRWQNVPLLYFIYLQVVYGKGIKNTFLTSLTVLKICVRQVLNIATSNRTLQGRNNLVSVIYTCQRCRGHFKYFILGCSKSLKAPWPHPIDCTKFLKMCKYSVVVTATC